MQATQSATANRGRSILAVVAGFVLVFVLSLSIDQILHVLKVYPPWGEPMNDPGLNILALSYRIVITVLGAYVTGRLAPRRPMKHAMILGGIGFVFACLGVIAGASANLGPLWYPVLLAVTTLPCTWLGGKLGSH